MAKQYTETEANMLQAIMNHSRLSVLAYLEKNDRANISQIARAINLDRSTVVYHLDLLGKVGLIKEESVPVKVAASTGIMGHYFVLDKDKVAIAIGLLRKELATIEPSPSK